jgi:hypothetical protein
MRIIIDVPERGSPETTTTGPASVPLPSAIDSFPVTDRRPALRSDRS